MTNLDNQNKKEEKKGGVLKRGWEKVLNFFTPSKETSDNFLLMNEIQSGVPEDIAMDVLKRQKDTNKTTESDKLTEEQKKEWKEQLIHYAEMNGLPLFATSIPELLSSAVGKSLLSVGILGFGKEFLEHPVANVAMGTSLGYQLHDHYFPSPTKLENEETKKIDAIMDALHIKQSKDGKYHQDSVPALQQDASPKIEKELDEMRKEMKEQDAKLDALLKAMQLEKNEEGEYQLQKHEIKGLSHLSDEDKAEANRRNNIPTRMEMADFFEKLDGKMTGRLALIQMKLDQSWGGAINENWLEKLYDAFRDDDRFEWFFQEFFYQEWTKITMHFNYDNDDELV